MQESVELNLDLDLSLPDAEREDFDRQPAAFNAESLAARRPAQWIAARREDRWLKLISGAVMIGLGVLLIVRPDLISE